MRKLLMLIIALAFAIAPSWAGSADKTGDRAPVICFGVEWGYTANIYEAHHYNYLCEEGYRLDEIGSSFALRSSANFLITFGFNIKDKVNYSIAGGSAKLFDGRNVVPFLVRVGYYPKGLASDGIFFRLSGGMGFEIENMERGALMEQLGGGYRFSLSRAISLDLALSLEGIQTSSVIYDPDTGNKIPERNIRSNVAGYCALNMTVALVF